MHIVDYRGYSTYKYGYVKKKRFYSHMLAFFLLSDVIYIRRTARHSDIQ